MRCWRRWASSCSTRSAPVFGWSACTRAARWLICARRPALTSMSIPRSAKPRRPLPSRWRRSGAACCPNSRRPIRTSQPGSTPTWPAKARTIHLTHPPARPTHFPLRGPDTVTAPNPTPCLRGALDGLRVIDASRVLGGPYAGQVLADHGADVIKVEPPGGDETRGWGPPFDGDAASYFVGVNRNKRGIAIDCAQPAGQQLLRELLSDADVFIENFKIGTLERWGLGSEALRERFPRLIHCRVSGFGADGPYGAQPGYDAAVQALCGIMSVNGEADGGPLPDTHNTPL